MKLENIGFYTLSDNRAKNSSEKSPLYRCEMILTEKCNFKCPYCRKLQNKKELSFYEAKRILEYWISEGLKNVRFSGGEPTLYKKLPDLVKIARRGKVEHIAISTNGSSNFDFYQHLINEGVNDLSISLDACCSNIFDMMSGTKHKWDTIINNIEKLSVLTYVTVGIVINNNNIKELSKIINFAHKLGVADMRIITLVSYNKKIQIKIPKKNLEIHPILKYRMANNHRIRGLTLKDARKCRLVLDDMAVYNSKHYPCIIYLREGGQPIGYITNKTRTDRLQWYNNHNSWTDNICRRNCLDVCIAYNNMGIQEKCDKFRIKK